MPTVERGQIDEIIYARLDQGGDLMLQLHEVCKQERIKTGVILDITGAMESLHVQHFPALGYRTPEDGDNEGFDVKKLEPVFLHMEGPLEVSGHGLIGEGWAPDAPPPDPRGFFFLSFQEHGDPYFHVHIVGSNANETICGHLMVGSKIIGSPDITSHFTVVIAKVSGVHLRGVWEQSTAGKISFHHEFVRD